MAKIIAGRFDTADAANNAHVALVGERVDSNDICAFYVNPAGEHAAFPIGGDQDVDAGTRKTHAGAAVGAAIGGAVGVAAGLAASAGAAATAAAGGVGAYTGSLVGALHKTGMKPNTARSQPVRRAGMLVAVRVDSDDAGEELVKQVLRHTGARDIEWADGVWRNGEWVDFDATASPRLVDTTAAR